MKRSFFILGLLLLGYLPSAWAGDKSYQFQLGVTTNYKPLTLSEIDSSFVDKQAFGFQGAVFEDQPEGYSYGPYFHRTQSTSNKTFYFMDGFGVAAETFWGDKETMTKKLPIWDKIWFKTGGRFGYYRAFASDDLSGQMSEVSYSAHYQAEGWFIHAYGSIGVGRIGAIEYTWRMHKSGGFSNSALDKPQLAYVQNWNFSF